MHKKCCRVKPKSEATQHHSGSKPTVRKTERCPAFQLGNWLNYSVFRTNQNYEQTRTGRNQPTNRLPSSGIPNDISTNDSSVHCILHFGQLGTCARGTRNSGSRELHGSLSIQPNPFTTIGVVCNCNRSYSPFHPAPPEGMCCAAPDGILF